MKYLKTLKLTKRSNAVMNLTFYQLILSAWMCSRNANIMIAVLCFHIISASGYNSIIQLQTSLTPVLPLFVAFSIFRVFPISNFVQILMSLKKQYSILRHWNMWQWPCAVGPQRSAAQAVSLWCSCSAAGLYHCSGLPPLAVDLLDSVALLWQLLIHTL